MVRTPALMYLWAIHKYMTGPHLAGECAESIVDGTEHHQHEWDRTIE